MGRPVVEWKRDFTRLAGIGDCSSEGVIEAAQILEPWPHAAVACVAM